MLEPVQALLTDVGQVFVHRKPRVQQSPTQRLARQKSTGAYSRSAFQAMAGVEEP